MVHRIEKVCGDQDLAHHYYHIALRGTKATNAYPIEGLDTHDKLTEQQENWLKPHPHTLGKEEPKAYGPD